MFSESGKRLAGIPTDSDHAVRGGLARGDERPMVTVHLNLANPRNGVRTFDDPEALDRFIDDLITASKWLRDHNPCPRTRARWGEGRRSRDGGR